MFGREPVPGRVKTRLARTLGDAPAAAVYASLLAHTLAVAGTVPGEVTLFVAEPPGDGWAPPLPVSLEVQAEGDLGHRMGEAFRRRFAAGADAVVLVGSDCPGLRLRHLEAAFAALTTTPAVLGPAGDGGYWLVGQRPPAVDMFTGVPWSAPDTLAATRTRLRRLGVAWRELETLADVDTEDDVLAYCAAAPPGDPVAQMLQEVLARLPEDRPGRSCP